MIGKYTNLCNIRDCKKCNKNLDGSCSGCSLCDVAFCECSKDKLNRCLVRCPRKLGAFREIEEIKVIDKLKDNGRYNLPAYIPVMPDKVKSEFDFSNVNNTVGIHGEFLLSSDGRNISPIYNMRGYKKALNLINIDGILEFYIKDRALEGFWQNRKELYKQFKKQNFKAIITPNFSVYEDAPRSEHLYNIQRSKRVYNEMIQESLPAIPDIIWATSEDLEFWINEINKSNIKTIAFSFMNVDTRLKASNSWRHYLLGYKILISRISSEIEIIIAGISSIKRFEEIKKISKNRKISIMHQAAWVNSRKGFSVECKKQLERSISKDEIFQMNLNYYTNQYSKGVEQCSI